MKIYIVRHGQTVANSLKIHNSKDEELTILGIKQAEELGEKLLNIDFDIIIASPLKRAIHTANIINKRGIPIIYDERLQERKNGNLVGKSLELEDRNEYWNYESSVQYGTSEDIKTFFKRIFNFLDELKEKDYSSVLIVAHAGVSIAFSCYFEGIQDGKCANRGLKNCVIKEYDF